jgi:hypothetical protein
MVWFEVRVLPSPPPLQETGFLQRFGPARPCHWPRCFGEDLWMPANCQLARWSEAVIRDQTSYGFYSCRLAGPRGRLLA